LVSQISKHNKSEKSEEKKQNNIKIRRQRQLAKQPQPSALLYALDRDTLKFHAPLFADILVYPGGLWGKEVGGMIRGRGQGAGDRRQKTGAHKTALAHKKVSLSSQQVLCVDRV